MVSAHAYLQRKGMWILFRAHLYDTYTEKTVALLFQGANPHLKKIPGVFASNRAANGCNGHSNGYHNLTNSGHSLLVSNGYSKTADPRIIIKVEKCISCGSSPVSRHLSCTHCQRRVCSEPCLRVCYVCCQPYCHYCSLLRWVVSEDHCCLCGHKSVLPLPFQLWRWSSGTVFWLPSDEILADNHPLPVDYETSYQVHVFSLGQTYSCVQMNYRNCSMVYYFCHLLVYMYHFFQTFVHYNHLWHDR